LEFKAAAEFPVIGDHAFVILDTLEVEGLFALFKGTLMPAAAMGSTAAALAVNACILLHNSLQNSYYVFIFLIFMPNALTNDSRQVLFLPGLVHSDASESIN